jgi:hypothetical protein
VSGVNGEESEVFPPKKFEPAETRPQFSRYLIKLSVLKKVIQRSPKNVCV